MAGGSRTCEPVTGALRRDVVRATAWESLLLIVNGHALRMRRDIAASVAACRRRLTPDTCLHTICSWQISTPRALDRELKRGSAELLILSLLECGA